jgi:hypothetical protein
VWASAGRAVDPVELRQRERRLQFEAPRLLGLRDDSGQEGVFRRRGIGGEQHFAAHPMQFRFKCAMTQAIARRERFVEDRKSAIGIARPGFGLGQRDLQ